MALTSWHTLEKVGQLTIKNAGLIGCHPSSLPPVFWEGTPNWCEAQNEKLGCWNGLTRELGLQFSPLQFFSCRWRTLTFYLLVPPRMPSSGVLKDPQRHKRFSAELVECPPSSGRWHLPILLLLTHFRSKALLWTHESQERDCRTGLRSQGVHNFPRLSCIIHSQSLYQILVLPKDQFNFVYKCLWVYL